MSLTSGFFNAILDSETGKPDRTYNARDISNLFTGLILDGVFMSIGTQLRVTPGGGSNVLVGEGKAWFNGTWTINDAPLQIACGEATENQARIDAIVLEVDSSDGGVRNNTIKCIPGTPDSKNPTKPDLLHTETLHQYALCYITRKADVDEITVANIENTVGTSETPFVSGVLEGIDLDKLLGQWRTQLDEFVASESADVEYYKEAMKADFESWYADMKAEMAAAETEQSDWVNQRQTAFDNWFAEIMGILDGDAAGNIALRLNAAQVENILMYGLPNCTKRFSADGSMSVAQDADAGLMLIKTFTNNFLTSTSVLTDATGTQIGTLTKTFSTDGATISSVMTNIYATE